MNSSTCYRYAKLGLLVFGLMARVNGQEDPKDQPVPKAVPIEDLLPKFGKDMVVISRSKQFKISGADPATRAVAANLAEDSKDEILRMLEERDDWKVPVIVEMRGKFGDPVPLRSTVLNLDYNEVGYQVKIFVNLSRGLPKESYQRAVIAGCIMARSLKDTAISDANVRRSVPPWLVEGISEAISWRLGQSDRRLYDALFRHGGLYKLEDLFELNEAGLLALDAASKAAFRVSAGALVMALSEQPDGKAGMRAFLKEAPSYSGEFPVLLRQHFPELNMSQSGLAKWWNLQLASKGTAPLAEALSVTKTDEELERALKLRYRDAENAMHEVPIREWNRVPELSQAERVESVRLTEEELVRLSYRCFPSYRPLLQEYQLVLSRWVAGDTKDISTSMLKLAETREVMVAKSARARDFLDWFEITRARETSGEFDDFLTLKNRLKAQSNPRKDSITKYLDRLDPLFVIPEQRKTTPFPLGEF
jgi:hypothetical protein